MNLDPDNEMTAALEQSLAAAGWNWDKEPVIQPFYRAWPMRSELLSPDYILRFHNMPVAVLEVKHGVQTLLPGLRQATGLAYGLHVHFAIATNGTEYFIRNLRTGSEELRSTLPTALDLLEQNDVRIDWRAWAQAFESPWFVDPSRVGSEPQFLQQVAVFEILSCLASGHNRALISMPSGTGKTLVAAQLCSKLLSSDATRNKKILFITDRVVLREQIAMVLRRLPNTLVTIINGDSATSENNADVLVTTVQTLLSRDKSNNLLRHVSPEDIGFVICADPHSLSSAWLRALHLFPRAFQLAMLSSGAAWRGQLYDYFTSESNGKPIFDLSLSHIGILDGLSDEIRSRDFSPSECLHTVAGCVLLKSLHDQFNDLFRGAAGWDELLMQPVELLPNHLRSHLLPVLANSGDERLRPYRWVLETLGGARWDAQLFAFVASRLAQHDLSNEAIRHKLLNELDRIPESVPSELLSYEPSFQAAHWIADILQPRAGESIYDPAVRTGRLVSALIERGQRNDIPGSTPLPPNRVCLSDNRPDNCLWTLTRLALLGGSDFEIRCENRLNTWPEPKQHFDVAAINPPFGTRPASDAEMMSSLTVRTYHSAYLLHVLRSLAPAGRAAVIVPDGFLFSASELDIRRHLLEHAQVAAVVALPEGAFGSKSAVKTSLLLLRPGGPSQSIVFASRELTELAFSRGPFREEFYQLLTATLQYSLGLAERKVLLDQVQKRLERLRAMASSGPDQRTLIELNLRSLEAVAVSHEQEIAATLFGVIDSYGTPKCIWKVNASDLASRDFQLTATDRGDDAVSQVLKQFASAQPGLPVRTLGEIASVYSGMRAHEGRSFRYSQASPSAEYNDVLTAYDLVPVIQGATSSRWVGPDVYLTLPGRYQLRRNDILVAGVGKVGKVGIYKDDFVRHPHHDLLVIRVSDNSVSPEYVWRLLQTEPYQRWLRGHAVGSSFQRLAPGVLSKLPIPVPPAEFQSHIGESFKGRESAVTLIEALTATRAVPPAFSFLTDDACALDLASLEEQQLTAASALPLLSDLRLKWKDSCRAIFPEKGKQSALGVLFPWVEETLEILTDIKLALSLPDGADRYIALLSWELHRASQLSFQVIPIEAVVSGVEKFAPSAPKLVHALKSRIYAAEQVLLKLGKVASAERARMVASGTAVSATVQPSIIPVNRESSLTVTVANEGQFGVRGFAAHLTQGEILGCHADLFAPGNKLSWTFKITPDRTGRIPLLVRCLGIRADDESANLEISLAIDVQESVSGPTSRLDRNPYIVGPSIPADKQSMFFGRHQIVDDIRRSLRDDGPSTVLVVEGNRRLGKSSLLHHLQQPQVLPGWIPVYLSFQRADGVDGKDGFATATVFYNIAKALLAAARANGTAIAIPGCGVVPSFVEAKPTSADVLAFTAFSRQSLKPLFDSSSPFEALQLVIETILASVENRRILLMLDEFDKLQVGIDTGVTSPLVPENLRNLFHTYSRISGILVGSRRMREMRNQYFNALFGMGKNIRISALERDSASQLITEPSKGRLVFAPPAVDFILSETACQPFLIQGICDRIFSHYAASNTGDRVVTLEVATACADAFSQDNEHFSQVWFDDVKTDLRHFLLCLVDTFSNGGDPLTAEFILHQLERSRIGHVDLRQVGDDLEELARLEILSKSGPPEQCMYRINIPLLARWMRQNVDYQRYRLAARMETE